MTTAFRKDDTEHLSSQVRSLEPTENPPKPNIPQKIRGTVTKSSKKTANGQPRYLGICLKKNSEDVGYPRIGDQITLVDLAGTQYGPVFIGKMDKYRVRLKKNDALKNLLSRHFPSNRVDKPMIVFEYTGHNYQFKIHFLKR